VWVGICALLSFSSLACSLGVLILCFGISLVWGRDLRSLSFSSLAHVPWGFDLVFWNQFSVGRDLRASFPFLTRVFP
jgi:hypothetical protein